MIRLSEETVTVSATESGWGVVRKTVCKPTGSLDHQTFNTSSMAVLTKSLLCILTMSWILVQNRTDPVCSGSLACSSKEKKLLSTPPIMKYENIEYHSSDTLWLWEISPLVDNNLRLGKCIRCYRDPRHLLPPPLSRVWPRPHLRQVSSPPPSSSGSWWKYFRKGHLNSILFAGMLIGGFFWGSLGN